MSTRRDFLKVSLRWAAWLGFAGGSVLSLLRSALAEAGKILLPRGTDPKTLVQKNPADLDTRLLEIMPLDQFETMGLTDYRADSATWRLEVDGLGGRPQSLTRSDMEGLPPLERNVLLICPGIFVNHGRWKGFSVKSLLRVAGPEAREATHVTFRGPRGPHENSQRFPIADILSDRVFLAYRVNGEPLPRKHGFPLRVVAEGYYGFDWIKYVDRVTFEAIR
jgi:DMSO/TMAO reductase YedYZ molybdopterin-dependent catalytic subunit